MSDLRIIGTPHSNFTWTARIVCVEKGAPYVFDPIRPHTPEVRKLNPFGLIPVMTHGDVVLFETRAICAYIDQAFEGPSLVPQGDPIKFARTEQWISAITTSIDQLLMRRFFSNHRRLNTPDGESARAAIEVALKVMPEYFAILESIVGKTGHLIEDKFSLADAYLVPMLFFMTKLPESAKILENYVILNDYLQKHLNRASINSTAPPADYAPTPEYYAKWNR